MNDKAHNFKVVIVGDVGVGKTCIFKCIRGDIFEENVLTTVGADKGIYHDDETNSPVSLELWDTAGQEAYRNFLPIYFRGVQAALVVYSIDLKDSFDSIDYWVQELAKYSIKIIYLVENKNDIRGDNLAIPLISLEEGEKKATKLDVKFASVSAKTGSGVKDLFHCISQDCLNLKQNDTMSNNTSVDLNSNQQEKSCC